VRQGTRFLIGPLVGVVAVATLTGCGSSDNDADPVLGPPTTEVTSTTEVTATTEVTTTEPAATTTTTKAVAAPATAAPAVPVTTAPRPVVTGAPKPVATPVPGPPAMSAQELASLEAELSAIDAILNELAESFSAD
jgi:hypothetical protein